MISEHSAPNVGYVTRDRTNESAKPIAWTMAATYAFLLLSPFSIDIFTFYGSYVFEIPVAICIVLGLAANDPIARLVKSSITAQAGRFYIAASVLLLLCLLGALAGGNFLFAYADLRANLMLLLGLRMAFVARSTDRRADLLRLAVMCTVLSVAYWGIATMSGLLITKYAASYMAAAVAIVLGTELRLTKPILLSLACLIFIAGVSFFRQYWIVAVLAGLYVVHSVFTVFEGRSRRRAVGLLIAGCIVATGVGYSRFEAIKTFFVADESRYIQGVGKTNDLTQVIQGNGELAQGDSLRLGYFQFIAERPLDLLLPHGLGYRSYIDNIDPYFSRFSVTGVNTIDSLAFYVAFHYGLIIGVPLLGWLLLSFFHLRKDRGFVPSVLLYSILLIPILFDGGQATVIYRSFWLGSFAGVITYRFRLT